MNTSNPSPTRWSWLIVLAATLLAVPGHADPEYGSRGPRIRFESTTHDFGRLKSDGGKSTFGWSYRNAGDQPLKILGTRPSCGCTATVVSDEAIPPGGTGVLEVTFDPVGQHGTVRKSLAVSSNDPQDPTVILTVKAFVEEVEPTAEPGAHPPVSGQSLLMGKCAECHAAPAKAKRGEELYAGVCAMCHGGRGEGGLAPSLREPQYLESRSDDDLAVGIGYGTANPSMPGFSKVMGGPLDDAQVRSLVELMRSWQPQGRDAAAGRE